MQDQEEMTRKRSRNRNRSKQRSRRRSCRQRTEGKPPQQQRPQPTARDQWARGAEMCIQTSRSLFEWHHNQVMALCQGFRQEKTGEESRDDENQRTPHCLDYVYESSSEEEEEEEEYELEPEPIDEGYLQFLEVTIKHQEEVRRRRADTTTACSDELKDKN